MFSAYTLQHPAGRTDAQLARCWVALCRVYQRGDDPARVFGGLRHSAPVRPEDWDVAPLPARRPEGGYRVTIKDLGGFEAAGYAEAVDRWCQATLDRWGSA